MKLLILMTLMVFLTLGTTLALSDVNGDGDVDKGDLNRVQDAWGDCPKEGECPEDVNGDGTVNVKDLLQVLGDWTGDAFIGHPRADINGDGTVNVGDLLKVLGAWGECSDCPEDINSDGVVNDEDLMSLINSWGDIIIEGHVIHPPQETSSSSSGGGGGSRGESGVEKEIKRQTQYSQCYENLWTEVRPFVVEMDVVNTVEIIFKPEYNVCRNDWWSIIREIFLRA